MADGKEKEVYIDFSKEEEVVPAEVQSTETREATFLDKIAGKLPTSMRDSFEQFADSYNQHRKYYLIGLAVAIIIIVIVAAVGILLLWDKNSGPDFDYGGTTSSIYIGPITLTSGENQKFVETVDRPAGAYSLRKIILQVLNEKNETIPSYTVFAKHLLLLDQNDDIIAGTGSEGQTDPAMNLPDPYVVTVGSDDVWSLYAEVDNLWGVAAGANLNVYFLVQITYTDPDDTSDIPVNWRIIGDFPGSSTAGNNVMTYSTDPWKFVNSTLVAVSGHMSIGGLNMTLKDSTNDIVIASVVPIYDTAGYITSIPQVYPEDNYQIPTNVTLTLTAVYTASPDYSYVINIFQIWGTFPQMTLEDIVPPDPSASPIPQPSSDPSPTPDSADPSPDPSPSVSPSSEDTSSVTPSVSPSASPSPASAKKWKNF